METFGFVELFISVVVLVVVMVVVVRLVRSVVRLVRSRTSSNKLGTKERRQEAVNSIGSRTYSVFISYRRQDSAEVVGRINDRLVSLFGGEAVFQDVDSIPLGVDFAQHIDLIMKSCRVVLVVIGREWLLVRDEEGRRRLDDPNDHVRLEIEAALNRDIPIIPVTVGGSSVPKEAELPPSLTALSRRNGLPVRPDPDFHRDINRLVDGIKPHIP